VQDFISFFGFDFFVGGRGVGRGKEGFGAV
jgi:hypothetical protein